MNRTDRLYALVEELRARAPRPLRAAELAARFEVSTRTIERDLLALQEAGVPIWTQPGPGGGYSLNPDTTLPPLNLTPEEAVALATALAAMPAMPFAAAGHSALGKLAAVMAAAPRATAGRLAERIRVTPLPEQPASTLWDTIQRALLQPEAIQITYQDRAGAETVRTVEPGGLLGTGNGWYLVAWCRLRQGPRTFRLDRIARVVRTGEAIAPPDLDALLAELPHDLAVPTLR
ncbi:MAG: WYL domain-containing protein [Thermomicrobiales bacterium]|nr:WYL domain-containing protein [Thermomicrobiales bacterium]